MSVCYITPALLRRIIGGRAFKDVTSLALHVGKEHGRIRVIEQLDEFTSLRELDVSCHEVSLRENNGSATSRQGLPIVRQVTRCDKLAALPQLEKLTLSHNRLVRQSAASTPSLRIAGGTARKGQARLAAQRRVRRVHTMRHCSAPPRYWLGCPHVTGAALRRWSGIEQLHKLVELRVAHNHLDMLPEALAQVHAAVPMHLWRGSAQLRSRRGACCPGLSILTGTDRASTERVDGLHRRELTDSGPRQRRRTEGKANKQRGKTGEREGEGEREQRCRAGGHTHTHTHTHTQRPIGSSLGRPRHSGIDSRR